MNLLGDIVWDDLDVDELLQHSYKDFHAKGLDYLCLHRDRGLTLKAYFFAEGMESQKFGEVINPHDHRYHFTTQLMSGIITNKWYQYALMDFPANAQLYNAFGWLTPLNGGQGFSELSKPVHLQNHKTLTLAWPGGQYVMDAHELHTIQVGARETCIVLAQYEDVVPLDQPTLTFTKADEPPSLAGLYTEFKPDELVARINLLRELNGNL
ncbi:hypothetical protein PBI_MRMAGOO_50 [Mycobacterium phage MrMagoo]|uniref:Uncharacterized protein n=1 Tax=Mycobacterium phage MrMagoo TaxID=1927020 RepID=A0A1L6BYH6_9CAUD|nr:hypothetical protein J4U04_gp050 [Mycobacterium phage MrMagoo]APQ42154.1 hypothetical protein PBI_MRMAGOO_50 [Mycobacterium phage MrMagoo]ARM70230.1 hypothetical protein SEA_GARDENSALSA_50 [Mycobacterium phage GardenSalsa]